MKERAQVRGMHMGICVCVLAHRWLHMGVGRPGSGSPETRDAERAVPARLGGKGTAVALTGDGMGLDCLGAPGTQTAGTLGWDLHQAPRSSGSTGWIKGLRKGNVPQDIPPLGPLLAQLSWAFPPQEQSLVAGGARALNWEVCAGLLVLV